MANASKAKILAADVPTPGMRRTGSLPFTGPKWKDRQSSISESRWRRNARQGREISPFSPPGRKKAHKGVGGQVLIIGGGPYQGAPWLAGLGALRAGADIVRIASPVFEPVPDLIFEHLEGKRIGKEHTEQLIALAERADVVVCGNGMGTESHDVVTAIAPHCKKAVFDAEASNFPCQKPGGNDLHPHAGEFARITGTKLPDETLSRARAVKGQACPGRSS